VVALVLVHVLIVHIKNTNILVLGISVFIVAQVHMDLVRIAPQENTNMSREPGNVVIAVQIPLGLVRTVHRENMNTKI
jgi:hypothetical protein